MHPCASYNAPVSILAALSSRRRSWRLLTVILSLWALLFAQAAVAGYACPGVAKALEVARMTEAGMPCADSMSQAMDDEQPLLCHAQCQSARATPDSLQPPNLPSLAELGSVLMVSLSPDAGAGSPAQRPDPGGRRRASPPLAISHCCLRI